MSIIVPRQKQKTAMTTTTGASAVTMQSFFVAFYGRPADRDGLTFWTRQLDEAGGDFTAIGAAFAQSQEALFRFGDATLSQRIAGIYDTLFSHAPDGAGLRYWLDAVEQGHISPAGVGLAILQGAQGGDRELAALRLEAAARFTQQTEAGASDYHGYAAIEAGRVVLRAVTPDMTPQRLDALVTSALTFSAVLSDHPGVIEALAPRDSLLGLFDGGRGAADPALMAQALGLIAAAAAHEPAAMRQLLRKGGVAEVLDDIAPTHGLQYLVDLVRDGGLEALMDLAYPPPPPQPPQPEPEPEPEPPTLSAVSFGPNDGHLAIGEAVSLRLVFDENVQAAAGARLLLNNLGSASYTSGNGSTALVFTYIVQEGDSVADLMLAASGALVGGIANDAGVALAAGSLDGIDPAGVVIVDGVQASVAIAAGVDGLRVTANKPGDVLIEEAGGARFLLHAGNGADPVDAVIGQLAGGSVTGTIIVRAPSGNLGVEAEGILVAIGSNAGQGLAGQYVWGHGGDDVIDGTAGDDMLFGGDGNDTIRAGAGADVVHGGRGGDTIDLGADDDVDRLVYGAAEFGAGLPLFQDGGTTAHIDRVDHLGVGDIIDLGRPFAGMPVARTTYLSGLDGNEFALVCGSAGGGRFVKGDSAADHDFMLQWVTGGVVGSAILRDVGSRAEFTINHTAGTLTLATPAPAMSLVTSVSYSLLGATSSATFEASPDPVTHTPGSATGLADREGFSLLTYRDFTPRPADPDYLDGPLFGLRDNVLSFDGPFASDLYSLFWTDHAFDTTAGYLATDQVFFAGGHNNGFDNDGFAVVGMYALTRDTAYTDTVQRAIFGPASGAATVTTGRGHDVVLSKDAPLTVAYSAVDAAAEDLILDFDPAKDLIGVGGSLRSAIDANGDGLFWIGGSGAQIVVGPSMEAVQVTLASPMAVVSSAPSLMAQTLATLNAALDVRQLAQGDDLLILARHSQHSGSAALLYYQANDGDGIIDADEITFIATFNGGAPAYNDIVML
jgi:hypothetical protein